MKISFYFFLIALLMQSLLQAQDALQNVGATNIISFFLKEYPEKAGINNVDNTIKECNILKNHFQTICQSHNISHNFAIFSTYAGYLSMSNTNGQISFPRKVINNSINLLVTNKVNPVFMFGSTIAFWEIQDPNAKMYFLERSQDKETKLFFWETKEKPLPKSNRVPVQTIILFADPKEIYVPVGATITRSSANLLLPDIYVRKNMNNLANILFVLNIKPFFSKTNQIFKEIPIGYESLVVA
ncbi:MAG: hypothetical protein P4L22_00260 [Candidatus Babeliales bacterium]|nr:hypothetical protein [Candidatus Babeliales bacterium]